MCHRCGAPAEPELQDPKELLLEDGTMLEIIDKFCYLRDMIGAAGGAEDAARTRVRCGWKKFNELHSVGRLPSFVQVANPPNSECRPPSPQRITPTVL